LRRDTHRLAARPATQPPPAAFRQNCRPQAIAQEAFCRQKHSFSTAFRKTSSPPPGIRITRNHEQFLFNTFAYSCKQMKQESIPVSSNQTWGNICQQRENIRGKRNVDL